MILNGIHMVYHHVCYKEIHGYDLVILIPKGEHFKLHSRLRKEGKCNIPVKELNKISMKTKHANKRTYEYHKKYYSYI